MPKWKRIEDEIEYNIDTGACIAVVVQRVSCALKTAASVDATLYCIARMVRGGRLAYDADEDWLVVRKFMPETATRIAQKSREVWGGEWFRARYAKANERRTG